MNTTRKTIAAECAAAIRADLKKIFPGIKFKVTSKNYAGGNSVNVGWTNGPTVEAVESLIGRYEMGHFDGMADIYVYSNDNESIPQTKYLFCNRSISEDVTKKIADQLASLQGDWSKIGSYEQERRVYAAILELGTL